MEGDHALKPLLQHEEYEKVAPQISPDGQWMSYDSTESGQNEVYVRPFPDVDKGKWQVSTSGGGASLWSPKGRELFYLSNENYVMAPAVETESTFSFGTPRVLFKSRYAGAGPFSGRATGIPWDISPDGRHFLMMKEVGNTPSGSTGPRKINIVLNWLEGLKQRVPVK